jgi:hypothetical protein
VRGRRHGFPEIPGHAATPCLRCHLNGIPRAAERRRVAEVQGASRVLVPDIRREEFPESFGCLGVRKKYHRKPGSEHRQSGGPFKNDKPISRAGHTPHSLLIHVPPDTSCTHADRSVKERPPVFFFRDENETGNFLFALFIPDDDLHDVFIKLSPGVFP